LGARGGQAADGGFDPTTIAIMPSEQVTRLHLFRHGEVREFEERVVRGQLDVPLSARGAQQNARLARWFAATEARPDRLYASDLGRCRELADGLGTAVGLEPVLDARLREQDMGRWQGRTWREITAEDGPRVTAYWNGYETTAPPGGESLADMHERVGSVWAELRARHAGGSLAVVTHVGPIRSLLCRLLDVPLSQALRFAPAVASHTCVLVSEAGAVLTAFGERAWSMESGAGAPAPAGPAQRARPARRIALSGSAGTGKTTLGRALAERLSVPFLEERMRPRLEAGLDLHALTTDALRALLRELWEEQRALEDAASAGFVADRSSLDYAAFWLHYGLLDPERESGERILELAREARRYERILLFPWGVLPLVEDGVRSTNRWVQLRYQTLLEGLLGRWALPGQVLPVPAVAGFAERMVHVLGEVGPNDV